MGTYRITGASAFNRNCVTGAHDHLYEYLKEAIAGATAIDMNVSFLMVSGVRLMLDDLKPGYDMCRAAGVPFAAAGWANDIPEIEGYMRRNCDYYFKTVDAFGAFLAEQ